MWFNLLYSMNVKTNIGKVFLNLLRKHSPLRTYSTKSLIKMRLR